MTITAHDLATTIRHEHNVTADLATEAVENYVAMIEYLDGREINRDAICDLDTGFILMAFAVAQHTRESEAAAPRRNSRASAN